MEIISVNGSCGALGPVLVSDTPKSYTWWYWKPLILTTASAHTCVTSGHLTIHQGLGRGFIRFIKCGWRKGWDAASKAGIYANRIQKNMNTQGWGWGTPRHLLEGKGTDYCRLRFIYWYVKDHPKVQRLHSSGLSRELKLVKMFMLLCTCVYMRTHREWWWRDRRERKVLNTA